MASLEHEEHMAFYFEFCVCEEEDGSDLSASELQKVKMQTLVILSKADGEDPEWGARAVKW